MRNNPTLRIAAAFLFAGSISWLTGCTTITPGNVGIEINKVGSARGVQDVSARSGFVGYNPITHEVVEYPVSVQTVKWTASAAEGKPIDESITFTAKGGTVINADISGSFQLDEGHAPAFYVKFRADKIETWTDGYFRNVVRDAFDEVGGNYSVEEIMGNNGPILKQIVAKIQEKVGADGITVSQLGFIGAPRPPQSVTDAINQKTVSMQLTAQKQNELAQTIADGQKLKAKAQSEADAEIIHAQADAQANKLRSEALTPAILREKAINKWDGTLPHVQTGNGAGALLNLNGNE